MKHYRMILGYYVMSVVLSPSSPLSYEVSTVSLFQGSHLHNSLHNATKLTWIEALWPKVSGGPLAVVHAADEPARLAVRVVLKDLVVGARVDDDRVHGHGAGHA